MSGGLWNYKNNDLASELFGWDLDCHYGEEGHRWCKKARAINPLEDRELSEMLWDMMCLLNSKDFYECGDIGKDGYDKDKKWFKQKWCKRTEKDILAAYREDLQLYCDELKSELSIEKYKN